MTSSEQLIWAAGFFDGEGCVSLNRLSKGGTQRQLSLSASHEAAVRRVHTVLGEGNVYYRAPRQATHKPMWTWVASSKGADRAAEKLLPYLVVKREQALLMLRVQWYVKVGSQRDVNREAITALIDAVQALNGNQKGGRKPEAVA